MTSGMKREVINTRERAVSGDINRLQDFLASEVGQAFYEQCGKYATSDDRNPGTEVSPAIGGTPPFNAVLNGLRPYPVNGTLDMLVTPGVLLVDNLAAGADDAPMLYCNDPGITALGVLQLVAAPAGVRIDVIECQPTDTVLETDNRDIFNIATGLFAPVAVTKVQAARLTYRIRAGVAGAGFPGLVAGWVPLAVVRVPIAAANWDACDIWDVRNLVSEFWNAPFQSTTTDAEVTSAHLSAIETAAGAPYSIQLTGKLEGHYKHFRLGGTMVNYPTAATYVDITTGTTNWAAGMAVAGSVPWYVYLAFPFALPGWRKYASSAVSPRTPSGLRGIPIVTSLAPAPLPSRIPAVAIAIPTALGFAGTTSEAVCVFAGMSNATPRLRGASNDGKVTINSFPVVSVATVSDPLVTGISRYTLIDNMQVPSCAKSVLINLDLLLTKAAPPGVVLAVEINPRLRMYDATGTFIVYERVLGKQCTMIQAAATLATWQMDVEVPLLYRANVSVHIFDIVWNIQPSGAAFTGITADQIEVRGWRV